MQPQEIQNKIYEIRGQKIMLDRDLSELYSVENRALKQAVKRNMDRFPADFMFQLTVKEIGNLVSQNVIPSKSHFGGALPFAFTEQGVAMLSSVLKSKKALQANIAIMRVFVEVKRFALQHAQILEQLKELKQKINEHDTQLSQVYTALEQMIDKKTEAETSQKKWEERERIGFKK